MAKRVFVYVSKTDPEQTVARIADVAAARADADAYLGPLNWTEYDVTAQVLPAFADLVNVARMRDASRDGTGRWRWRTISDVVKRWLGEPVDETCGQCGQKWPTT